MMRYIVMRSEMVLCVVWSGVTYSLLFSSLFSPLLLSLLLPTLLSSSLLYSFPLFSTLLLSLTTLSGLKSSLTAASIMPASSVHRATLKMIQKLQILNSHQYNINISISIDVKTKVMIKIIKQNVNVQYVPSPEVYMSVLFQNYPPLLSVFCIREKYCD